MVWNSAAIPVYKENVKNDEIISMHIITLFFVTYCLLQKLGILNRQDVSAKLINQLVLVRGHDVDFISQI